MTKLSKQVLYVGEKKGEASRRQEGDAKWEMDYNSVGTQVLKIYLLKPRDTQTHMFKSDYSRFITLKLKFQKRSKNEGNNSIK